MYWFRAKVPADLRATYAPQTEVIYSLRTDDPRAALEKVRIESVKVDQEFALKRRTLNAESRLTLSDNEIDRLAAIHLHNLLEEDDEVRMDGMGEAELFRTVKTQVEAVGGVAGFSDEEVQADFGLSQREYRRLGETLAFLEPQLRAALARGDTSIVRDDVDELLDANGIKLVKDSPAYRKLSYAVMKANLKAIEGKRRRQEGELLDTPPSPAPFIVAVPIAADDDNPPISVIFERWKAERKPPAKTASDFGTYIRRFREINGDVSIKDINAVHVRAFKSAMLMWPKTLGKKHHDMTVPQVLAAFEGATHIARLSPRTVKDKALGAISAVLGYAKKNHYRSDNPAAGFEVAGSARIEPPRIPFSSDDLKTIFASPVFTQGFRPKGGGGEAAKWLPLLALFTGARLEELGRLTAADIRTEGGITYLFINTIGEGKRVKNRSSRRKVPIHTQLVALGFLSYVEGRRKAKDVILFPELKSKRAEITAAWSPWWGRYMDSIGIEDRRKVFHSFRHLVKRALRDAAVDKTLRDALMGHAHEDVAEAYGLDEEGMGFSLSTLDAAVQRLAYPSLDLSHLLPNIPAKKSERAFDQVAT
jgi:integrase